MRFFDKVKEPASVTLSLAAGIQKYLSNVLYEHRLLPPSPLGGVMLD